ncbi:MAG: THUMP domain-containing protein, partial [Bacteroidales bacterium]|nr:THUMP domain-containing protein [Bacteroidales bacterium]
MNMRFKFIAKTFSGLEEVLCRELTALGAENCQPMKRSVGFEGDFALLYRINYFSFTALRVLWEMTSFSFHNNKQFYEALFDFEAERYLAPNGTLAVSVTMHDSIFKTPLFAAMLAKDAICDRFRDRFGKRPSVNRESPDVQFHLHIFHDSATLFLDSSGESLHKRGYKVSNHPAPINEVLAAGMLQLSNWQAN